MSLSLGRVLDFQMRQQIQADRLRNKRVGPGNECLRSDDCGEGTQQNRKETQSARQHFKKWIEIFNMVERNV